MTAASVSLLFLPLALHYAALLEILETVCPNGRGTGPHNSQVKTKLPSVRVLSPSCSLRTGSRLRNSDRTSAAVPLPLPLPLPVALPLPTAPELPWALGWLGGGAVAAAVEAPDRSPPKPWITKNKVDIKKWMLISYKEFTDLRRGF